MEARKFLSNCYKDCCRICLLKLPKTVLLYNIFEDHLRERILDFSFINLLEGRDLPKFICQKCIKKLDAAEEFKQQIEITENILKQHKKTKKRKPYPRL
ncbi:hypothetical protein NQ317_010149 [Molorchus minor]|uniref:ZAD domain-containing protein n=1 Tax=Molorchus minor TaxID=1323400 RepID=A0ABQ9JGZ0_9CUCU|nr:hypothetical protein NQ317_010149 [Molorchus minor]